MRGKNAIPEIRNLRKVGKTSNKGKFHDFLNTASNNFSLNSPKYHGIWGPLSLEFCKTVLWLQHQLQVIL